MPSPKTIRDWITQEMRHSPGKPIGAGYQATVSLHDSPFGRLVVKSARTRGILRHASVSREHEIYERLANIPGIPRSYGIHPDIGLVLEYVDGAPLREREKDLADRDAFFALMLATIEAMHEAGVAHCDLKRKDNTIVGPHERPYLIDFGVACILRSGDGWAKRTWFALMRQMDFNAWVKLKYGRDPKDLPQEVARRYHPLLLERVARAIRIPWQKLTLRRLRKRRRKARQ